MPQVNHYEVTATVTMRVAGPFSYAEAVAEAQRHLGDVEKVANVMNGVQSAKVAAIHADRR